MARFTSHLQMLVVALAVYLRAWFNCLVLGPVCTHWNVIRLLLKLRSFHYKWRFAFFQLLFVLDV